MAFLELSGIQKVFAGTAAVVDFNLSMERGEFVSFLGPSGCGKTTTLRMIAGFETPTAGQITVEGPFLDAGDSVLAVTGGTGKYAGARGDMNLHARNPEGSEYDFVYNLQ